MQDIMGASQHPQDLVLSQKQNIVGESHHPQDLVLSQKQTYRTYKLHTNTKAQFTSRSWEAHLGSPQLKIDPLRNLITVLDERVALSGENPMRSITTMQSLSPIDTYKGFALLEAAVPNAT